jgi:predicted nucleic acid-binding protein
MSIWVVDTSALIRLYVPDGPLPDNLETCIESAWRAESNLLAPELLLAEAGQVLRKKELAGFLQPAEGDEIIQAICSLPITWIGHADLLPSAIQIARDHELTVYDALFLALAMDRKAGLVTADKQLGICFERL